MLYVLYKAVKRNADRYHKGIAAVFFVFHSMYSVASVSSSSNFSTEWLWIFWALMIAFQGVSTSKIKREIIDENFTWSNRSGRTRN
jgi:hypothetical protein